VYDYLLFDARKTKRWRDKIAVWFGRTGWRPADVEARYPKQRADLSGFEKFDPPVVPGIRRYTVAQFVVAIVAVLWIGEQYAASGPRAVLLPCIGLWLLLLSLGWLNQGRANARQTEWLRLLSVPALLLIAHIAGFLVSASAWGVAAGYVGISAVWLLSSRERHPIIA